MEIWKNLDVLSQHSNRGLLPEHIIEEKIHALVQIAIDGYPSLIGNMLQFLRDNNKDIQDGTYRTIVHLFKKIKTKNDYYDTLKHCRISPTDVDFYENLFPEDQFVDLLIICSFNGNGFVREKAVWKLAQVEDKRAIQFLIFRLADWVLPVRQAALTAIEHYRSAQYIDALVEQLQTFEWLQSVERVDLSGVYNTIIDFISITGRDHIIANFKNYSDKNRLLLAKHLSQSSFHSPEVLSLFLNDKHFLIRLLAINHLDKLSESEVSQLLNDKSAKVRLQILYSLKDQDNFKHIITKYLADDSARIRHLARFTLRETGINVAECYIQNLHNKLHIVGSLIGLSEIGAVEYSETIENYLENEKIRIIKTAFLALGKLDKKRAYTYALDHLDTPLAGLRKLFIDFLLINPQQEVLTKATEIYTTGNYDQKKAMLKFFITLGVAREFPV